ncbi:MAG: MATE family efflux transporter, partial [Polyangiaceae bacterium]|nr:MATE family efflux transporter [Polyangiaceae bacterium]
MPVPSGAPVARAQNPGVRRELGRILWLALPISLAQFGQMLLGLVDVAILGHVSSTELGGASIGRAIGFVSTSLCIGVAAALEPLAAQAVGASEERTAWEAFTASLGASVAVCLPGCILAILSTWLLEPLGIERALIAPARAFLVAQVPGLLFFALFLSAKTYLQAHGRTAPALLAAVTANVVNVVVCNVLVRGSLGIGTWSLGLGTPPLGAFGAGIASSIASFVLASYVLVAALRLRPHSRGVTKTPYGARLRKVVRIGTPISLQILAEIGVFSLVAVLAGRLGAVAASAHSIAVGLASFAFMGVLGVSGATAVRVGHAIGEGRSPRQSGLIGIGVGATFMALFGIVFLAIPDFLMSLFTNDVHIRALGVTLLRIAAAFEIFDGVQVVAAGALRGAGDIHYPFLATLGAHWTIGFPLALFLAFHAGWGAPGLWWGLLVGLVLVAFLLTDRFLRISRGLIKR